MPRQSHERHHGRKLEYHHDRRNVVLGNLLDEPRYFSFDEMSLKINDPTQISIRTVHRGMANIGFADGSVHQISDKIDPEVLKSLITVADGKPVECFNVLTRAHAFAYTELFGNRRRRRAGSRSSAAESPPLQGRRRPGKLGGKVVVCQQPIARR